MPNENVTLKKWIDVCGNGAARIVQIRENTEVSNSGPA